MSTNEKIFNYGLPNRIPKLPKQFSRNVKSTLSKYAAKNWDLYNPEPIPYQRNAFKPSTVSKIIDIPKRIINGFMYPDSLESQPQRGIIIHTERYAFSNMKEINKSQNERLIAEENYLKTVKYRKAMSESRLKTQSHNLILEGENLLSSQQIEKSEGLFASHNKGKLLYNNMEISPGVIPPAPTILESSRLTQRDFDPQSDLPQPISMAVQKIQLINRAPGMETVSSAPVQSDQRNIGNLNSFLQNSDSKFPSEKLPPIGNNLKEFENYGRQSIDSFNSHFDYESAYKQSERFNRPNARINEYIMGGISVKFTERADIQGELRYLKSIILPSIARELYVGRGIQLPSNHATKVPRGKYLDDNLIKKPVRNSDLKIDTPGGGSITINTTPSNNNYPTPEAFQNVNMITSPSDMRTLSTEDSEKSILWSEMLEQINNNVNKNDEGFMETQYLMNIIQQNSNLKDDWKRFLNIIFESINVINEKQLKIVLETQTLCNNSQFDFSIFEIENAKSIIPTIFKEILKSEDYLNIDQILNFLTNSNQFEISQNQINQYYDEFLSLISQVETRSQDNFPQFHCLLFIPFLLKKLKSEI